MPSPKRRIDAGIAQQLLSEPHRFGFFQSVRIIEQLFKRQTRSADDDAVARRMRFGSSLSLGFPASELEKLEAWSEEGERLDRPGAVDYTLTMEKLGKVQMTPSFMGLLGVKGALPWHYGEWLHEREIFQRDRAARAFLDIFTNRAVALHYGAWKKYRLAIQYELDQRERFLPLLLSLAGVGVPGLRDRLNEAPGAIPDQAVAFHAATVGQRPVAAVQMQRLLTDYFQVPVKVEQFVGAWYEIPEQQRTCLGASNARLGVSAVAGERVWQRDLRMRLVVGPLEKGSFDAFLPGGEAAQALEKWLTMLTGASLEYEVRLVLKAEEINGCLLGDPERGGRLGWDGFLSTRQDAGIRTDTTYGIHTLQ